MALGKAPANDLYAVLGVPRDADEATIKRAFRARARECHPDTAKLPGAAARFRELANAYDVLSSRQSRLAYDRVVACGSPPCRVETRIVRSSATVGVVIALAFLALIFLQRV